MKKLLRAVPAKFLQIVSTIEQFRDLEVMTIEETVRSLKAHEERLRGQVETLRGHLLLAMLLTKFEKHGDRVMLFNEDKVVPKLSINEKVNQVESNLWYLDNGASNHMKGHKSKFMELDERVTGGVKFGDGSVVHIKGKGSIIL